MAYQDQCDQSQIEYRGNGSQRLYTFPFTYLKPTDIYVDIFNESTRRWAPAAVPYTWTFANATTIEFNVAPPTPQGTNVFNIRISRCTDIDPLSAQFNPGSAIRAVDLNDNFEQLQLAIEEGRCQIPNSLYEQLSKEYWNKYENTVYSSDPWVSDNLHVASTRAIQNYIQSQIVVTDPTQTYTQSATGGTLTLSPGGDTTEVPVVTSVFAGLMSATDKITLDGLSNAPSGGISNIGAGTGISITGSAAVPIVNVAFGTVAAGQTPTTVMPYNISTLQPLP